MGNRILSSYLDLIRIAAALMVVIGHARMHALGVAEPANPDLATKLLYLATGQANAAVTAFFVISGYLVGGKLFNAGRPGFLPKYMLDRATRIYVVALPVLLIAFVLMLVSQQLYGLSYRLNGTFCAANIGDLAATVALLHRGFGFSWCFDSPVWSLVFEVYYYVFFALVAVAWLRRGEQIGMISAAAAIALGIYGLFEPSNMWALSTIWLLGMVVAQKAPFTGKALLLTLTVTALFAFQSAIRWHEDGTWTDGAVTMFIAGSILVLRRLPDAPVPRWLAGAAAAGAAISYSLYMAHSPILNLARGIAERSLGVALGSPVLSSAAVAAWAVMTLLGVVAGVAGWWLFERHTQAIRVRLENRFGIANPRAHQPIPAES